MQTILWIDLETTGLDPAKCVILEVAAILTDLELNELATYEEVIVQEPALLTKKALGDWVFNAHTANGLLSESPQAAFDIGMVEHDLLQLIKDHPKPYLAGNSIHFDRSFLKVHTPDLLAALHYRQLDMSTLNVLATAWGRAECVLPPAEKHRAMSDIRASLAQAKKYAADLF